MNKINKQIEDLRDNLFKVFYIPQITIWLEKYLSPVLGFILIILALLVAVSFVISTIVK